MPKGHHQEMQIMENSISKTHSFELKPILPIKQIVMNHMNNTALDNQLKADKSY
jgi:hypothetical protein